MVIRRLVLVISIVVSGSLALAAAVLAAGSGGLPPGQTLFSEMSANASFGGKGGPPEASPFSSIRASTPSSLRTPPAPPL